MFHVSHHTIISKPSCYEPQLKVGERLPYCSWDMLLNLFSDYVAAVRNYYCIDCLCHTY